MGPSKVKGIPNTHKNTSEFILLRSALLPYKTSWLHLKGSYFGPDTSLILDPQLSRVTLTLADMARRIQRNDTLPIMVVKDNEEFIRSYTQHSVLSLMESMSTISFKSTELAATTRHVA